jgi:hypothetical protein
MNFRIESVSKEDCLVDDFLREQRKGSGLTGADGTNVGVGLGCEVLLVFATAEDFGLAVEFEVNF